MGDVLRASSDGSVKNLNTGEVLIPSNKPQSEEAQAHPALGMEGFRPGKLTVRTGPGGEAIIDQGGTVYASDVLPPAADPLDNAVRAGSRVARHLLRDTDIIPDPQLGGDVRIREAIMRGLVKPV